MPSDDGGMCGTSVPLFALGVSTSPVPEFHCCYSTPPPPFSLARAATKALKLTETTSPAALTSASDQAEDQARGGPGGGAGDRITKRLRSSSAPLPGTVVASLEDHPQRQITEKR